MMKNWKIVGFVATVVIVLSVPLYLLKQNYMKKNNPAELSARATYVGKEKCIDCHRREYDLWRGSDHDWAMAVATDSTVLGDFNNAEFEYNGKVSRFYKKDGRFYVFTEGPNGKWGEFEIVYTFGVRPLQQYLVPFPGGRYQCLPLAWDTEKQRWFNLVPAVYPNEDVTPNNWLHWTNQSQNWNGMCAECHSTNLQKNYDLRTDQYHTTWSEINVSCEACHGPGSAHLEWAALPEMARPQDTNYGLVVQTSDIDNKQYVKLCVRCHSRRSFFDKFQPGDSEVLNYMIPQLLRAPYYFPDGQILEEDYVHGSFVQSKMYDNDVRCNDCHDVHSGKRKFEDNRLCLQCHRADLYDTFAHHFHKKVGETGEPLMLEGGRKVVQVGEGALCVNCHMPGRYYMGVDFRRDHSFRIPRPDLSLKIGVPNACTQCHTDKSDRWALDYVVKWYGESFTTRPHFGTVFTAAEEGKPEAREGLIRIVEDDLFPVIVRATAVSLLGNYSDPESRKVIRQALRNPESLIRYAAVRVYPGQQPSEWVQDVAPLLNDPVRAVRMTAAMRLTLVARQFLPPKYQPSFQSALTEYRQAMEYLGDFPSSRHNLGNMYANLGQLEKAAQFYQNALKIDRQLFGTKVNLALVYNRLGKAAEAEKLLREIIQKRPWMIEAVYYLGLLLAEKKQYTEAAQWLEKAARDPNANPRIFYNLGLVYQQVGQLTRARKILEKGLRLYPNDASILYALASLYLNIGQQEKAREIGNRLRKLYPENPLGQQILDYLEKMKQ